MKLAERLVLSKWLIVACAVIGLFSAFLVLWGNPGNMGVCIACFIRDIAGALRLHSAAPVQYIRPEIVGFLIGAFLAALAGGGFKARGGSAPLLRFLMGGFMMVGALVFLGCPTRMVLRLAGGDGNALLGLAGFIVGIFIATLFVRRGFSLGRTHTINRANAFLLPALAIGLLALLLVNPAFIAESETGPGSQHAAIWISLVAGLAIGVLGQRTAMCFAGGIRDFILVRDTHLLTGFVVVLVAALLANLGLGQFHPGFADQPIAHADFLWNFLGMALVGICAVMLGGCPFRQTMMAGEGNTDAGLTFTGMLVGAAFAHNFGLASSPKGPTAGGMIAVVVGLVFAVIVGLTLREK